MFKKAFLGIVCALVLTVAAPAQTPPAETSSNIPELSAFHEIIYPIWHSAYPNKDYAALRGFVPRVNELASKIYAAKLPGILRDKEAKWKDGVAAFKASVDAYSKAAAGTDNQALLTAAETLHSKYEATVRLINPVLPEMDAFHQALYVVYHKYLPAKEYDNIRGATADLVTKAEAAAKAALPARLAAKTEAYKTAVAELIAAAKALDTAGKNHDHDGMETGVDKLHAKYQALEKIFD
jgi:hypothetical protein